MKASIRYEKRRIHIAAFLLIVLGLSGCPAPFHSFDVNLAYQPGELPSPEFKIEKTRGPASQNPTPYDELIVYQISTECMANQAKLCPVVWHVKLDPNRSPSRFKYGDGLPNSTVVVEPKPLLKGNTYKLYPRGNSVGGCKFLVNALGDVIGVAFTE